MSKEAIMDDARDKPDQQARDQAIDVLKRHWYPLDLGDKAPETSQRLAPVVEIVEQGASTNAIANLLYKVARDEFGVAPRPDEDREVAERLLAARGGSKSALARPAGPSSNRPASAVDYDSRPKDPQENATMSALEGCGLVAEFGSYLTLFLGLVLSAKAERTPDLGALGYGIIFMVFVAPVATLLTFVALGCLVKAANERGGGPGYVARFLILLMAWIAALTSF